MSPSSPAYNSDLSTNAFLGQKFEHLPHLIHLSWFITGAPKPVCESAPTGHTLTAGQGWFCGQLSLISISFFDIVLLLKFIFFYTALLVDFFSYYRNSLFRAFGKATIAHCAFIVKRYFVFGKLYILHRAHRNAQSARNTLRVIRFYAAVIIFSFFTKIQPLPE